MNLMMLAIEMILMIIKSVKHKTLSMKEYIFQID